MAALLRNSDPQYQSALFKKWSPIVNILNKSSNAFSPGILAEVRAIKIGKAVSPTPGGLTSRF